MPSDQSSSEPPNPEGDDAVKDPEDDSKNSPSETLESEEKLGGPTFNPPLYRQRYEEVSRILNSENVTLVCICSIIQNFISSCLS